MLRQKRKVMVAETLVRPIIKHQQQPIKAEIIIIYQNIFVCRKCINGAVSQKHNVRNASKPINESKSVKWPVQHACSVEICFVEAAGSDGTGNIDIGGY
jgi:hypothetical protein